MAGRPLPTGGLDGGPYAAPLDKTQYLDRLYGECSFSLTSTDETAVVGSLP